MNTETPANKLKALLFDVDGTLADTERDGHRVAFNRAFDEFGLDWHWSIETYGELLSVTGGKERMRHYADNYLEAERWPDNFDTLIPELHKAKTRHYTELLSTGAIPLRPGVERLINEARERAYRLAIATTTTPENVTALLTHTLGPDSIDWFEVIAAGDIVPAKKPAPDIYDFTLQAMTLEPEECIAFEDSANGIKSSTAARLHTIITINDYTREHDFSDACLVLDQMGESDRPFNIIDNNTSADIDDARVLDCDLIAELHRQLTCR